MLRLALAMFPSMGIFAHGKSWKLPWPPSSRRKNGFLAQKLGLVAHSATTQFAGDELLNVQYVTLYASAQAPERASDGAAGYDLLACIDDNQV